MNKQKLTIGIAILLSVVVLVVIVGFMYFLSQNTIEAARRYYNDQFGSVLPTPTLMPVIVGTPTPTLIPLPTATPTLSEPPVSGWMFQGFTEEVTKQNGYTYHWGILVNDNGMKIKAMCPAPNSPAPSTRTPGTGTPGTYYYWDKTLNILIPVQDNQNGDLQRFWYPKVIQ